MAARLNFTLIVALRRTLPCLRGVITPHHAMSTQAASPGSTERNYTTRDLAPLLQLRTCDDGHSPFPPESRPLLLLFPWLGAKQRNLDRYRDLYTGRGYDVLTIQGKVSHFAWPPKAVTFTEELLNHLDQNASHQHLVVHAFSVGAYLYSILLLHLKQNPDRYRSVQNRIRGQIYDSVVYGGLEKMATGVAEVSPLPNAVVKSAAMAYFSLTRKYTVETYDLAIDTFIHHQLPVPTLLFYCENDPMSRPDAMLDLVHTWRRAGRDLQVRGWKESRHAGHIVMHRDEYISTLGAFLDSLPGASVKSRL